MCLALILNIDLYLKAEDLYVVTLVPKGLLGIEHVPNNVLVLIHISEVDDDV